MLPFPYTKKHPFTRTPCAYHPVHPRRYEDTLRGLRQYLDAHRAAARSGPRSTDYELRSAFPPAVYADLEQTLEAAGLAPNATLFMRAAPAGGGGGR